LSGPDVEFNKDFKAAMLKKLKKSMVKELNENIMKMIQPVEILIKKDCLKRTKWKFQS
jgi:hypothetical protein